MPTSALLHALRSALAGGWLLAATSFAADSAPPARVLEVGLGYGHGCARLEKGQVRCWGRNLWGQLGRSEGERSLVPVEVPGLPRAERLAVGGNHACILTGERHVFCWGYNHRGQLGQPPSAVEFSARPLRLPQLTGTLHLALGGSHGCAVMKGGAVYCWGDNLYGQLGDGQGHSRPVHGPLRELPPVTQVTLGDQHGCATTQQGEVWCWGGNAYGQLGDGTREDRARPAPVPGLAGATQLSLGYSHSCARVREGRVLCWGVNMDGQLGDGSRLTRLTPVPLPLQSAAEVAAGSNHGCALLDTGRVACWGSQGLGRLGDGIASALKQRLEPFTLSLQNIAHIAAKGDHSCAVSRDGRLYCWGSNEQGMLGTGTEEDASVPTEVR